MMEGSEVSYIQDRVRAAEACVREISSGNAAVFTRSARAIGYLEGECHRLERLVDHMKLVNAKLLSELRIAGESQFNTESVIQRLKASEKSVADLREQSAVLETLRNHREEELLAIIADIQLSKSKADTEYINMVSAFEQRIHSASKQSHDLVDAARSEKENVEDSLILARDEIRRLQTRLESAESEKSALGARVSDNEVVMATLRTALRDKDDRLMDVETRMGLLRQDSDISLDCWSRERRELEDELRSREIHLSELYSSMASLKSQLSESETALLSKDEMISTYLSKQAVLIEENGVLRGRVEALKNDVSLLTISKADSSSKIDELTEALREARSESRDLHDNIHRVLSPKLAEAEAKLRWTSDELEQARIEVKTLQAQSIATEDSQRALEAKVRELQSSLAIAEGKAQGMESSSGDLLRENKELQLRYDELTAKATTLAHEYTHAKSTLGDMVSEVDGLRRSLVSVELQLSESIGQLAIYEHAEAGLIADIRSFEETTFKSSSASSNILKRGSASDRGFFDSPVPSSQSTILLKSPPFTPGANAAPLRSLQTVIEELKGRVSWLISEDSKYADIMKALQREFDDTKKSLDRSNQKLHISRLDCDGLRTHLSIAEDDLKHLRQEHASVIRARDEAMSTVDGISQHLRSVLRSLECLVSDAMMRVQAISAGKMEIVFGLVPGYEHAVDSVSSFTKSVENVLQTLCTSLESTLLAKAKDQEAFDTMLQGRETAWSNERTLLLNRVSAAEDSVRRKSEKAAQQYTDMVPTKKEVELLKARVSELSLNNADLEGEYRNALSNTEELKAALNEAEMLCGDLRLDVQSLQSDVDSKTEEVSSLSEQLEASQRKSADVLLQLERTTAALDRVKADKDAVDNVRKVLEGELDRIRSETTDLRKRAWKGELIGENSFEAEKLLSALDATLEQLSSGPVKQLSQTVIARLQAVMKASTSASLGERIEISLKRLGELKTWCVDEVRSRQLLQEKYNSLHRDALESQGMSDELRTQLRRLTQTMSSREDDFDKQTSELAESKNAIAQLQTELDRMKRDLLSQVEAIEVERQGRVRLLSDNQIKDAEITRWRDEVDRLFAKLNAAYGGEASRLLLENRTAVNDSKLSSSPPTQTPKRVSTESLYRAITQSQPICDDSKYTIDLNEILSLKSLLAEKTDQFQAIDKRCNALEAETESLRNKLRKASEEIEGSRSQAGWVREEGRRSRAIIVEAVTHIQDLVNIVGVVDSVIQASSLTNQEASMVDSGAGLEKALNIPELSSASDKLVRAAPLVHDLIRCRRELEGQVRRVESERDRLQSELSSTESRSEERLQRLREEIQQLNNELIDVHEGEMKSSKHNRHVTALEEALRQEREAKNKAVAVSQKLREDMQVLVQQVVSVQRSTSQYGAASQEIARDSAVSNLEQLRQELQNERKELQAVNHHRDVLRDTIDRLEKQLREKSIALSDSLFQLQESSFASGMEAKTHRFDMSHDNTHRFDEKEALRREAARYRLRSLAMEELAELAIIRSRYAEELRILEQEIEILQSRQLPNRSLLSSRAMPPRFPLPSSLLTSDTKTPTIPTRIRTSPLKSNNANKSRRPGSATSSLASSTAVPNMPRGSNKDSRSSTPRPRLRHSQQVITPRSGASLLSVSPIRDTSMASISESVQRSLGPPVKPFVVRHVRSTTAATSTITSSEDFHPLQRHAIHSEPVTPRFAGKNKGRAVFSSPETEKIVTRGKQLIAYRGTR